MDYTGTFDSLAVDFATNKQKASLTLNEDARQAFENLRGKQITITIKAYKKKKKSRCKLLLSCTGWKDCRCDREQQGVHKE